LARRLKGQSSVETRSAVLDLIRSSGKVSRIELSERSGLTEATISKIVRSLLLDGLVVEAGFGDSTGGKRPVLLTLNTDSRYALGISLDAQHIVYVLSDVSGRAVHKMTTDGTGTSKPADVIKRVASEFGRLLRRNGIDRSDVIGIGVAGAGRLDSSGGVLRSSRKASAWEDFAVEDTLSEASGLPVILDNDANCAALGEFWSGRVPATRDFATVYMATGIGCGIVINGDIYRGASSNVGEIGHVILQVDGPECWCGSRGCLEMLAAPAVVVQRARQNAQLTERLGIGDQHIDVRHAFAAIGKAAAAGDDDAAALITEAAMYLSKAVLGVVNMLDINTLCLGGPGFAEAGNIYLATVRDELERFAFMRTVHPVSVEMSAVGPEAAALGAASVVLHSHLTPHHASTRRGQQRAEKTVEKTT
jgi:predicted NBD/HSP70 family sugar kinase